MNTVTNLGSGRFRLSRASLPGFQNSEQRTGYPRGSAITQILLVTDGGLRLSGMPEPPKKNLVKCWHRLYNIRRDCSQSHGLANAELLPYKPEAYGSAIYSKVKDIAVARGIPEKLPGIQAEDIPQLAELAVKDAILLYPVPVWMGKKETEQFHYNVMEEPK